jgi:NAD(P)-dependent dehydrogenase (short-subunit alcohol dehydrogenase family)
VARYRAAVVNDRILVVGGSAGIGAAIAANCGAAAVVWSRRAGVDATDAAAVSSASAAFLREHGAPFGLVHTVGDFVEKPLLQTSAAEYAHLLASNLTSVLLVTQAFAPAMAAARRGRIVLFAAAGADRPRAMRRAPVYFAIKAALVQLARSLAAEMAPAGVTVNVVSPGLIQHPHSHADSQARMLPKVPLGRLGSVADVASAVQWLLSPAAGYVTGENLTIDGGLQL